MQCDERAFWGYSNVANRSNGDSAARRSNVPEAWHIDMLKLS
jgi:hypothetical protein